VTDQTSETATTTEKRDRKQRRPGRWRRRLGWAAVAVVVLAGLLVVGLWQGVPWAAKHVVMPRISEQLNGEARLAEATFNPFTLRLELTGIEVVDEGGDRVAGVSNVVADAKWEVLWTWVPTLSELTITEPGAAVAMDASGSVNVLRLLEPMMSGEADEEETATEEVADELAGLLRLPQVLIERFTLTSGRVSVSAALPRQAFEHELGPVDLSLSDVTTEPGRVNGFDVDATLPSGATANWKGEVELYDLATRGTLTVSELDAPLYNPLIDSELGFVVSSGRVGVDVDYEVRLMPPSPTIEATVRRVELRELAFRSFDVDEPFYQLNELTLSDISAEVTPKGPLLNVGRLDVGEGVFEIDRMPGKIPPLQELLTMLLHQGFAELAERIQADMVRIEKATGTAESASSSVASAEAGDDAPAAGESGESGELPAYTDAGEERSAATIAQRAASAQAVPIATGELSVRRLLVAALGPWGVSVETVSVGPQSSSLHGEPFVGFGSARVSGVSTRTQPLGVDVERVELAEPWGELALTDAGELLVAQEAAARIETAAAATPEEGIVIRAEPANPDAAVELRVGEMLLTAGRVTLIDGGVEPELRTRVDRIEGRVTKLTTEQGVPSEFSLTARVNEDGGVDTRGDVVALSVPNRLDATATLDGVAMVPFSRYAAIFLGYAIDSGQADAEVDIELVDMDVTMSNELVLRDFYLGEEVASEQAIDAPIKLGLSLLRDRDRVIKIELPISGDLSDPQIDISLVVQRAINNVIGKIVSAPFDFIAGAFGGGGEGEGADGEDLQRVTFEPGSAEMTDGERADLDVLRKALAERPGLSLMTIGGYDAEADGEALRRAELDRRVEAWLSERAGSGEGDEGEGAATYEDAVEAMYDALSAAGGEAGGQAGDEPTLAAALEAAAETEAEAEAAAEAEAPRRVMRGARSRSVGGPRPGATAGSESTDEAEGEGGDEAGVGESGEAVEVAYADKLAAVREAVRLPEGALIDLAQRRAEAVASAIRGSDGAVESGRVVVGDSVAGDAAVTFELQ